MREATIFRVSSFLCHLGRFFAQLVVSQPWSAHSELISGESPRAQSCPLWFSSLGIDSAGLDWLYAPFSGEARQFCQKDTHVRANMTSIFGQHGVLGDVCEGGGFRRHPDVHLLAPGAQKGAWPKRAWGWRGLQRFAPRL